jgi:hypothetical protein
MARSVPCTMVSRVIPNYRLAGLVETSLSARTSAATFGNYRS